MPETQQLLPKVVCRRVQGTDALLELVCLGLVHDLEEQLLLRGKVIVKGRLGTPDPRADVGHRGALEPDLPKYITGGLENREALRFGLYFHVTCVLTEPVGTV